MNPAARSSQEARPAEQALFDCRDAFSRTLIELAEEDPRVCAVVNDSVSSTKLKTFGPVFLNAL